jgi:hypothetical protein
MKLWLYLALFVPGQVDPNEGFVRFDDGNLIRILRGQIEVKPDEIIVHRRDGDHHIPMRFVRQYKTGAQ